MKLKATKVFALFFLFFVNSIFVKAQSIYELPSGTRIRVAMDNEINSNVASANDTFTATVSVPVKVKETIVLPIGTVIEGKIVKAKRASLGRKDGSLSLSFETLRFVTGEWREIEAARIELLAADSSDTEKALTIAGGTALGAIFGGVARKGNGALIGAAIGTGAGAGLTFLKKGKDVRIESDEEFEIELTRNVVLPVSGY